MNNRLFHACLTAIGAGVLGAGLLRAAEPAPVPAKDLTRLSLDDLMNVEVTSVAKKSERLADAPAAITVLTGSGLRLGGALLLPDMFRTVPGMDVAQVNSHSWAVTSRGFNEAFANKLLVMMDGRTIYTPLFSGVFWDMQDVLVEDLDRIEIIRGPGASLWGANAMNGVINITTKSSQDTLGTYIEGGGGSDVLGLGAVRYGGRLSDHATYRVYTKYLNVDSGTLLAGGSSHDPWQMGRAGFRADWDATDADQLTFQGDYAEGREHRAVAVVNAAPPFFGSIADVDAVRAGNLLTRWTRRFSDRSSLQLQAYYDYSLRSGVTFREQLNTADLDLQHRFAIGNWNDIVWGAGYRLSVDDSHGSLIPALNPAERTTQLASVFVQDEMHLVPDHLSLTLGARLEHNDFTGFEIQPNARLLWSPTAHSQIWGAVSRAVRTPSRAEQDLTLREPNPLVPGVAVNYMGNPNFKSTSLLAYDVGYRLQATDRLNFDFAGYYYQYDRLRTTEPMPPVLAPPPATIPVRPANMMQGHSFGFEAGPQIQLADFWRVRLAYTFEEIHVHVKTGSTDPFSVAAAQGLTPRHQFSLVSAFTLPHGIDFTPTLRYVDRLPFAKIPAYVEMDLRIAWKATKHWEFAIVGENLLDPHHPEFPSTLLTAPTSEIARSIFGSVTWRF